MNSGEWDLEVEGPSGGAGIDIEASKTIVDGIISSNGTGPNWINKYYTTDYDGGFISGFGGGSGGEIQVDTVELRGHGVISASGADGTGYDY